MARRAIYVNVGTSLGGGQYDVQAREDGADAVNALAVLVADAATPTQAHVTTLNTAVNRQDSVVVSIDTTAITSVNQLKRALHEALRTAQASGIV